MIKKFAFNAMTCALAGIDDDFEQNLERKVNGQEIDVTLFENMKKGGFIIDDCFDELSFLKFLFQKSKFERNRFNITIAPTMSCNFDCPYCYQKNNSPIMTKEIMDAIIKRIEIEAKGKKSISIKWFGGEPLLGMDVICYISEKVQSICEKYDVSYNAKMISNTYLINDDIIEKLKTIFKGYSFLLKEFQKSNKFLLVFLITSIIVSGCIPIAVQYTLKAVISVLEKIFSLNMNIEFGYLITLSGVYILLISLENIISNITTIINRIMSISLVNDIKSMLTNKINKIE